MNRIVAVDFDGTCVTHEYPRVGADVPHAARVLKRLIESGVKIIVWTMRCDEYLDVHAREWFEAEKKPWLRSRQSASICCCSTCTCRRSMASRSSNASELPRRAADAAFRSSP